MRPPRANPYRDAWAGELDAARVGEQVRVAGWVNRRRDHGGVIFIDLRDRSGIVQLTFHPEQDAFALAEKLRPEHVLTAVGEVVRREERNVNPNLKTGELEISVADAEHLAESLTPPFAIDEDTPVDEMIRLRHRMLDLRRENMRDSMVMRHTVNRAMRDYLNANDFLEIETPILTRSTPEGARDFLVPSRLSLGRVLRAAAVAAAVQAAADDVRLRALLPDRALLPRRGSARRSPAGVHPARPRDGLRRGGGRPRDDRGPAVAGLRGGGLQRAAAAVDAHALRRGDAALRLRQAGPALRAGDLRPRRGRGQHGVPGLQGRLGGRRRGPRLQRRAARGFPRDRRSADRGRQALRRGRARLGGRAGGRFLALAGGEGA